MEKGPQGGIFLTQNHRADCRLATHPRVSVPCISRPVREMHNLFISVKPCSKNVLLLPAVLETPYTRSACPTSKRKANVSYLAP